MAQHIQLLRGTKAENDAYTGLIGEVTVDLETPALRVHDGTTAGGSAIGGCSQQKASTEVYGIVKVGSGLHVEDGVISVGGIVKPYIVYPEAETRVVDTGFTVKGSPFEAILITDTHNSTRWIVKQNGTTIADITSTTDLEEHTFTTAELSGLALGVIEVQIQYIGNVLGSSPMSDAMTYTVTDGIIVTPVITAPVSGSLVYLANGVKVTTSAFATLGSKSDTHKDSDWMITTDAKRAGTVVAQALTSADLTSHTFAAADISSMTAGNSYYVHARHRGNTLGESGWAAPALITARAGGLAPGGRAVYRHENDKGCVIEYNEFGVDKRLFVADAKYRVAKPQVKQYSTKIPGAPTWTHYYYPTCLGNRIDSQESKIDLSLVVDLEPYSDKLSDARFQAALTDTLAPVLETAKVGTDRMLADTTDVYPAAVFVRDAGVEVGIELQIPNAYQLLVIYVCGDIIDRLDPTLAAGGDAWLYTLGSVIPSTGRKRFFLNNLQAAVSSTEYNDTAMVAVASPCNLGPWEKYQRWGYSAVVPVAELD